MKLYMVMREYRPLWNQHGDINDDEQWTLTEPEITDLADSWGKPKAALMEQVEEA